MRPSIPEQHDRAPSSPRKIRYSELEMHSANTAELWAVRFVLLIAMAAIGYGVPPFGLSKFMAALAASLIAALVLTVEWRFRQGEPASVLGAAFGAASGIFVALLAAVLISRTSQDEATKSSLEYLSLLTFGYWGLTVGANHGAELLRRWGGAVSTKTPQQEALKLLDTSVLIDGRIADIAEAYFLEGVLGVPQFVLRELQTVADSSDALKRQRGRRGLEVLQRMQKMSQIEVRMLDDDSAQDATVDDKLVELARRTGAKIVTNDFNLNKVATVQGIAVLNVNLLANAMKPAVLPGESMRVLILREGKEPNQGVAYLDDGTMVVVDNARRMINKSVDVVVTSVHQTTAGKMIFGRIDERSEQGSPVARQAAAGAGPVGGDAG